MTRILSELLGTNEHRLHASLQKLEQASGHPGTDIRLSSELQRATQAKIRELGLDPHDTTGPELYAALQARFKADDQRLQRCLLTAGQQTERASAVMYMLRRQVGATQVFAMKSSVAKALLTQVPPKKTMKRLGYRSFDSFVKRESLPALFAATSYLESPAWNRQLHDAYKKLRAHDFENRPLAVISPTGDRWQDLAASLVAERRRTVFSFTELGALVILPVPTSKRQPPAAATATLILALQAVNDIQVSSTFFRLCQVKVNFGSVVRTNAIAHAKPVPWAKTNDILDKPVPWQIIQRYYVRFKAAFNASVFEPHVHIEDLSWRSVERQLARIEPSFEFWCGTSHLSFVHDHTAVSLNIIDAALNYSNQLVYKERLALHGQLALWHELLLRYLKHENIERTVLSQLQAELIPEPVVT